MATASWFLPRGPYQRKSRWGFQDANLITSFFRTLIGLYEVKHSSETGEFKTREVARASGNYKYDGSTQWDLKGGVGPLPLIGVQVGTGQCRIDFTSNLGSATKYDITATAKTSSGTEVVVVSYTNKTATSITIILRLLSTGALYDGDFDLHVHVEPA